jgi:Cu-Zn family superoxide dismutase
MRITLAATALLAGCTTTALVDDSVSATLAEPGGRVVGRASVTQEGGDAGVRIEVEGLSAGTYAAHIHRTGRCAGPAFDSAGPHWNPAERQHGFDNPAGSHSGDLPNLVVGADGRGTLSFTIRSASLRGAAGMLDADGAAMMLHAQADDYRTDPSGNSGARIACGVLN